MPLVSREPPTCRHPLLSIILYDCPCDQKVLRDVSVSKPTEASAAGPATLFSDAMKRTATPTRTVQDGIYLNVGSSSQSRRRRQRRARVVPFPAA